MAAPPVEHLAPLFDEAISEAIPDSIRFGTSSWTYEGWKGLLYYNTYKSEKEFNVNSLREYAAVPLFRTVCLDSTFYRPPSVEQLRRYYALVPERFVFVSKVWDEITIPVFPELPRHRSRGGQRNPHFLSSELFIESVLLPYEKAGELGHVGPFIFQFPALSEGRIRDGSFLGHLDVFLSVLPKTYRYAVEVRNASLLSSAYFQILNKHGCTHCFNRWFDMPSLKSQMIVAAQSGGLSAPFYVSRLLTPQGMKYEACVKFFQPYTAIKQVQSEVRDHVVVFARRAIQRRADAFILVNNRLEGNAPMTISAILQGLTESLRAAPI